MVIYMSVNSVIEYPEEGFAILEDENGKFLAFKDKEEIEEISIIGITRDWLFSATNLVKPHEDLTSF